MQKTTKAIRKNYIFISYSHKDSKIIAPIIEFLKMKNVDVWFDERLSSGVEWNEELGQAIVNCSAFIVFLSNNSIKSKFVKMELELAIGLDKQIYPIFIESCILTPGLQLQLCGKQSIYKQDISESKFYDVINSSIIVNYSKNSDSKIPDKNSLDNDMFKAIQYLNSKEPAKGIELLTEMAYKGNALAKTKLGSCYYEGTGVAKDLISALHWYKLAAEQGEKTAIIKLANMYLIGQGVGLDIGIAIDYFKAAARLGDTETIVKLANWYKNGKYLIADMKKAAEYYLKAAKNNDAYSQYQIGMMYLNGEGVNKDLNAAFDWLSKSASNEYIEGYYETANCYMYGHGVKKDVNKAISLYIRACDLNHIKSLTTLADIYLNGKAVTQNQEKAFLLYTRAANEDDSYGKYKLALCYYYGLGTGINYEQAFKILNTVGPFASSDDVNTKIGICYLLGRGVEEDLQKAYEYLSKSAERKVPEALYYLGVYYSKLGKNKTALKKYILAAEASFTESKHICGMCYLNGIGTRKNYVLACNYFKSADSDNYAPSTIKYAECNYFGIGTEKNYVKAAKLFLKATKFNDSDAQNYLGICHFYGNGVIKNYSKACEYFAFAKNKGSLTATNNLAICYKRNCGVHQNYAAAFENLKMGINDSAICQYNIAICFRDGIGTQKENDAYFSYINISASQGFPPALKELSKIYIKGEITNKNIYKYMKYKIKYYLAKRKEYFIDYLLIED